MQRIFNRFRPHGTGTFVRWERHDGAEPFGDYRKPNVLVHVRAGDENETKTPLQEGMDLDFRSFAEGDPVRLQFGEMSNDTSANRGGTRYISHKGYRGHVSHRRHQIYTGCHCVSAMGLGRPRVNLLALRVLEEELGSSATLSHMRDWRDGASTLQTSVDLKRSRFQRDYTSINIEGGLMRAARRLAGEVMVRANRVEVTIELPDTMVLGLVGRRMSAVVEHPALASPDLIIDQASTRGGTVMLSVARILDVAEAIALLEAEARAALPMAA